MADVFRVRNRAAGSVRGAIPRRRGEDASLDDGRMVGAIQPQRIVLRNTGEPVDGGAVSYAAELRRGYHSSTVSIDFPNVASSDPMYDVSPDGQHFAVLTGDRTKSTSITLLTNWTAELKR